MRCKWFEGFPDANSDTSFKLPVPTRQHMIDWVKKGFDWLNQDQEMFKKSIQACGVSSLDSDKVRNGVFFKQCMGNTLHNLEGNVSYETDDNPFEL